MIVWQSTPYSIILFFACGINLLLAFYSWRHYKTNGAKTFAILMFLVAGWSFGYGLELGNTLLSAKLFWAKFQYLGIAFIPATWFYLTLQYTGQNESFDQKPHSKKLLLLIPLVTAVLALTNDNHGLLWRTTLLDTSGSITMLTFSYGIWFWINVSVSYLFLIGGTFSLLKAFLQAQPSYNKRLISIFLIATVLPWIGNAFYIVGINPYPNIDLTPIAFTITGFLAAYGLFRLQFLKIMPIAYNTIIESMKDGIVVLDAQDRLIDMNPAAEMITQQSINNAIGQTFESVLSQCEHLTGKVANSQDTITEISLVLTNEAHYYEIQTVQLTNRKGKITGKVLVLHDTSEQKQVERVLQQAKVEAETAANSKSAFLANMSHEIRTPLNAVIGMAELLRNTSLSSEQQELVETIYNSSDALLGIINNILDFSKIEAGKVNLENEPFDLQDCIEVSQNLISSQINPNTVKLSYYVDDQTPNTFNGDVVRLRQILVNLLGNAAKFTEEGEISVTVSSELLDDGQYKVLFAVKDTGIGIPANQVKMLFESFSQADISTTRKYGGTGLGLAISKKLAQLMGGTIWVESQLGIGSTFFFTIIASKATRRPERLLHSEQPRLRGKRLLIIASNADSRRFMSRETRSWGMTPYVASSSSEALYWLSKTEPFDMALIDQTILENEDVEFIDKIKKSQKNPIPIILLSKDQDLPAQYSHISYAENLQQPFTPSQLNNTLVSIFSSAQGMAVDPKSTNQRPSTDMGQSHPLRILLTEDNLINQKVATRILQNLGYQADIANNGSEALNALRKDQYDVVLMDIQMPVMDGVEATQIIQDQWPAEKQPQIIAMTAHALEGDREHYLSKGMDNYLSKPIQIEKLVDALYNCTPINEDNNKAVIKTAHPSDSPIDMAALESMIGNEAPKLLQELLPIFIQDAEKSLKTMHQAVNSHENSAELKSATHSLKGTSANLGMTKLSSLCEKLEAAESGQISELVMQIAEEVERIKSMIPLAVLDSPTTS